ncbi:MAG: TRAP transporter small permease [Rhizobiaceae bacterium]|nr:TRAP transporter small permease [Rhizobiaceae bacterium]
MLGGIDTVRRITGGLALLGAAGVMLMLVHVTAYVIMRHFASSPIPATIEIVSYYYMLLIAFLPIAWAERRGDMITVEVFQHVIPNVMKRWIDVVVALVTFAAYVALTYTTWLVAMREFGARSFVISLNLALPTWPGYFVLPTAFALAAAVSLYRAARGVAGVEPISSTEKGATQ